MLPHPLGLFAIIFGILLTLRKLDVGHRLSEHFPNVPAADFERWKAQAMAAYGFGVWVCFLKLVVDFAGSYLVFKFHPTPMVARSLGIPIDVAWVVAMLACWRKVRAAHALAERLGIEAQRRPEPDPGA